MFLGGLVTKAQSKTHKLSLFHCFIEPLTINIEGRKTQGKKKTLHDYSLLEEYKKEMNEKCANTKQDQKIHIHNA